MIDFIKGKITGFDSEIIKSFKKLPPDKYEKSKGYYFRFRRFSKFRVINQKINFLSETNFFQDKKTNRYAGGLKRQFQPISEKVKLKIIKIFKINFLRFIKNEKKIEVGLHQLRIKCGKNFVGYPVPEGWHKDGFDYVILINFGSTNIKGGITRIKQSIDQSNDVFSSFLKKGEFLFVNDKKYFHYTDPINVVNQPTEGTRDTLVITIKKI